MRGGPDAADPPGLGEGSFKAWHDTLSDADALKWYREVYMPDRRAARQNRDRPKMQTLSRFGR